MVNPSIHQTHTHAITTTHKHTISSDKFRVVLSKGAPEVLLGLCSQWLAPEGKAKKMDEAKLREIDGWCDAFSAQVSKVCV